MNGPLTENQAELLSHREDLERRHPDWAPALFKFLSNNGCSDLTFVKRHGPEKAHIRIAPAEFIADQFDVQLEIPVLAATFADLHQRWARELTHDRELRMSPTADKDFAILVAADPQAVKFARDHNLVSFPVLVLLTADLADGHYDRRSLRDEMDSLLRSANHFKSTREIKDPNDFFGRQADVLAIKQACERHENVGVVGLRRSGKSSLLHQVRAQLDDGGFGTAHISLNSVDDDVAFREALVEALASVHINAKRPIPPVCELVTNEGRVRTDADVRRRWIYDAKALVEDYAKPIVLFIDEIDLANEKVGSEASSDLDTRRSLAAVMRLLRGLIQKIDADASGSLTLVTAGVASSLYTSSQLFGVENPLMGFASVYPLGMFDREDTAKLVRRLGKRSGMKFADRELIDDLFAEYGGHPYLTRVACASIADYFNDHDMGSPPRQVSGVDLERAMSDASPSSAAAMCRENLSAFGFWYPEEEVAVRRVAAGEEIVSASARHAQLFGILDDQAHLRMGALRRSTA